jgi:hypothetical protein
MRTLFAIRHVRYWFWRRHYQRTWLRCLPSHTLTAWTCESHLDAIWRGEA